MAQTGTVQPLPRISGQIIINELVRNMELGCLELGYSILVPCIFSVYLHPDDFTRVTSVENILKDDAKRALTARMAEWNAKGGLLRRNAPPKAYRIASNTWWIGLFADSESTVPPGDVEIHSELNEVAQPGYRGTKTTLIDRAPSVTSARVARDRNIPVYGARRSSQKFVIRMIRARKRIWSDRTRFRSVAAVTTYGWISRSMAPTRFRANTCGCGATRRAASSRSPI